MSPVKVYHSAYQGKISRLLPENGVVLPECAIKTNQGTKVADIAWSSEERFRIIRHEAECSVAPEICIEVFSSSNTNSEMDEKRQLYIAAGAVEFWVCNEHGDMSFFNSNGKLPQSNLAPRFPARVRISD